MMIEPARRPLCSKRGGNLVESQNFDTGETSHMGRLNTNRYNDLNSSMFKAADSNRVGMRETNRETKGLGTIGNFSPFATNSRIEIKVYDLVVDFTVQRENFDPPLAPFPRSLFFSIFPSIPVAISSRGFRIARHYFHHFHDRNSSTGWRKIVPSDFDRAPSIVKSILSISINGQRRRGQ